MKKQNAFTLTEVFLPHSAGRPKTAFTLAEVLITLGIIGVVAALTLPTLIQNYRDKVMVSQAKKTYSNFSNVLNLMKSQVGASDYSGIFATGETAGEIVQNFAKYYNGSTVCLESSDQCGTVYNVKRAISNYKDEEFGYPRLTNADGSSIHFRNIDEYSCIVVSGVPNHNDGRCATIVLDVNGEKKGPNQYGADVHQIIIYPKKTAPCGVTTCNGDYGALGTIFLDGKLNYKK